jgi:hypothetical protein
MGQGDSAGRPGRLVPAVRGAAHGGGGGTATGARGQTPGPTRGPTPGTASGSASGSLPASGAPGRPGTPLPAPPPPVRPEGVETAEATELLSGYLNSWSADFQRSLRVHGDSAGSAETAAAAADAVYRLRRAARRLSGTLHTYRPLLDTAWADQLAVELKWLSDSLSHEYGHAARLERLLTALQRLANDGGGGDSEGAADSGSGGGGSTSSRSGSGSSRGGQDTPLSAGAARAGALLERQLTLARTRAHSAALQALVSARFHAVADAVAVLAYEVPLTSRTEQDETGAVLVHHAEQAWQRLVQAVGALPLSRMETPYYTDSFTRPVTPRTSRMRQDAAWHEVRRLLRLHRYAEEVLLRAAGTSQEGDAEGQVPDSRLVSASAALDRHRDAVEAAEAAASAARTPRIAPATAYALGVLHADQRQEVEAARLTFGGLWLQTLPQVL